MTDTLAGQAQNRANISIHTPHTRCDPPIPPAIAACCDFNPHTSYEVWPTCQRDKPQRYQISIHTPHTRCDYEGAADLNRVLIFQSTHLIRGVTFWDDGRNPIHDNFNPHTSYEVWHFNIPYIIDKLRLISIHTPHTRCDRKVGITSWYAELFQSTHLIRGVTFIIAGYLEVSSNFNPHTSYEVWLSLDPGPYLWVRYFNPHTSYEVWPFPVGI